MKVETCCGTFLQTLQKTCRPSGGNHYKGTMMELLKTLKILGDKRIHNFVSPNLYDHATHLDIATR